MSQNKTPTIDPTIISGTQLTAIIDDNTDTELTTNSGTMRPAYAKAGTLWLNTANAALWDLNFFDGSVDVTLGQIDPVAHTYVGFGTDQYLLQDGSEPMLGNLDITTNAPSLRFIETDASVDNGRWDCYINGEALAIRAVNDANSASGSAITIFRTGVRIDATLITSPSTDTVPVVANDIPNLDYVNSAVATLTNKTLTSPVLTTPIIDGDVTESTLNADLNIARNGTGEITIDSIPIYGLVILDTPILLVNSTAHNIWTTYAMGVAYPLARKAILRCALYDDTVSASAELYMRKTGSGLSTTDATLIGFAGNGVDSVTETTINLDSLGQFDWRRISSSSLGKVRITIVGYYV